MKKGFTLIEVLVVAIILAILSATAIPVFNGYIQKTSTQVCEHTAAMVLKSIVTFISDSDPTYQQLVTATYDLDGLNAILGRYMIELPDEFDATIIVNGTIGQVTVIITDEEHLGMAELGS